MLAHALCFDSGVQAVQRSEWLLNYRDIGQTGGAAAFGDQHAVVAELAQRFTHRVPAEPVARGERVFAGKPVGEFTGRDAADQVGVQLRPQRQCAGSSIRALRSSAVIVSSHPSIAVTNHSRWDERSAAPELVKPHVRTSVRPGKELIRCACRSGPYRGSGGP